MIPHLAILLGSAAISALMLGLHIRRCHRCQEHDKFYRVVAETISAEAAK